MTGRPLPIPDESSAPFWAAAAEHVLTVARCARCAALTMPPDVVCPNCHSTDPGFTFTPVERSGRRTLLDRGAPGVPAGLRR